jgi:hypothetical protein
VIVGTLLLVVGLFLPVSSYYDSYDDTSYMSNLIDLDSENDIAADGPGVYVLIVAAVALLLIVMDREEFTWATSLLIFFPLFIIFAGGWIMAQNDTATNLEFGWLVLAGGLILMSVPLWPGPLKTWLDKQDINDSGTEEGDDTGEPEDSDMSQEVEV